MTPKELLRFGVGLLCIEYFPSSFDGFIDDLARQVYHHVMGFRTFQKSLGLPIGLSKAWLDIDFPDGPPPEYERSGYDGPTSILLKEIHS